MKTIVVVLGNRLNDDGSISKIQEERLLMALELEEKINPEYFILTGGAANPNTNNTEASAMYEYLVNHGVKKEKLILEDKSFSTVENAKYSSPIIKKLNPQVVIICTSNYHLANPEYKAVESFLNELKDTNIIFSTYTRC